MDNRHTFKVGDRVRLTADNCGYGNIGDTGTVLIPDDGADDCIVRFDRRINNDTYWYVAWSNLELIAPAFKVGDRVQTQAGWMGGAGTVVGEKDGAFIVAWDGITWSADELFPLTPLRAAPPLTPGVRVRILGGIAAGGEGTVIGLNAGNINVRTDDLHTDRAGQFVRHVTVTRKHVIPLQEAA